MEGKSNVIEFPKKDSQEFLFCDCGNDVFDVNSNDEKALILICTECRCYINNINISFK